MMLKRMKSNLKKARLLNGLLDSGSPCATLFITVLRLLTENLQFQRVIKEHVAPGGPEAALISISQLLCPMRMSQVESRVCRKCLPRSKYGKLSAINPSADTGPCRKGAPFESSYPSCG